MRRTLLERQQDPGRSRAPIPDLSPTPTPSPSVPDLPRRRITSSSESHFLLLVLVLASTRADVGFSEDTLRTELQSETPGWILSSFGAGKHEPNLFFGYDTSPEELRWKSVVALKENRAQDYVRPQYPIRRGVGDCLLAERRIGERGRSVVESSADDDLTSLGELGEDEGVGREAARRKVPRRFAYWRTEADRVQ